MTTPQPAIQVDQLDGSRFGGLNCTCGAAASAVYRATMGKVVTSAATVRGLTGDTIGGTTLRQVAFAVKRGFGVELEIRLGIEFEGFEQRLYRGQGAIIQGWEAVIRNTRWSASETFGGNHAWFCNEARGWDQDRDGNWRAEEFLIYNPLADGRRKGIAKSPYWVPRSVVREWTGKLDISSVETPYRPLGIGRVYAAFTRDTEPHVHLRDGAERTEPFPDHVRAHNDDPDRRVNVRRRPNRNSEIVDRLEVGDSFVAYQRIKGERIPGTGSPWWYGSHGGHRWVHESGLRNIGGAA